MGVYPILANCARLFLPIRFLIQAGMVVRVKRRR
jgi:hypothetical protein